MKDTHLEDILIINKLDIAVSDNDMEAVSEILNELLAHTRHAFF